MDTGNFALELMVPAFWGTCQGCVVVAAILGALIGLDALTFAVFRLLESARDRLRAGHDEPWVQLTLWDERDRRRHPTTGHRAAV